jgi:hypothetical protein
VDHGQVNYCFAAFRQRLVVLAQPTIAAEPSEGSLDDPAFGQNLEAGHVVAAFDDLQDPVTHFLGPLDQFPGVSSIGPDQLEPRELSDQLGQHQLGPVAVLDMGGMHDDGQKQAQGVYDNVPLAPFDLLAGVVAARPPFSAVFTDWLSMIAAEGLAFRPSWTRTFRRRAS